MTYLQFHLVFILPVILALAAAARPALAAPRFRYALAGVAVIALAYTTPWDNYLVWKGVWVYGAGRVLGVIGYVPVEEYLFFVLQPFLTGLWLYALHARMRPDPPAAASGAGVRAAGGLLFVAVAAFGAVCLGADRTLYLGLILAWCAPVLAGQWAWAGAWMWSQRRLYLAAALPPTLYLWVADRLAIGWGIWSIAERYTTGAHLFGLPLEEAVFFLVTNLLVVQGLFLFLQIGRPEARPA